MEQRPVAILDGRRVREELDLVNLTQRQFAARLGLRESTISAAIRGKPLASETIYRIVLGLSLTKPVQAPIDTPRRRRSIEARKDGGLPVFSGAGTLPPQLDDKAGIFEGETAEALANMEYSVMRDPELLAYARRVMSEAMDAIIARHTATPAPSDSTVRQRKGRS